MPHNLIDRAIQVPGALGVTSDTPLEHSFREAWGKSGEKGPYVVP